MVLCRNEPEEPVTTLALTERRDLAYEVFLLLQTIDPSRFRDELREGARARIEGLSARLRQAVREAEADAVRAQFGKVVEVLEASPQGADDWEVFRKRLHVAYDELATELKREAVEVPTLRPTNYTRSFFHVFSAVGSMLLVQHVFTSRSIVLVAGGFALAGWLMEISRRVSPLANRALMWVFKNVAHEHERHRINSSTWYTTALALIALTMSPMACSVALMVLGVGDPAAGLVGRRFGRTKLRGGRSLEGSLAFVGAGGLGAAGMMAVYYPALGLPAVAALSLASAAAGALAELFITKIDDNFSIPVAAGAACSLVALVLGVG